MLINNDEILPKYYLTSSRFMEELQRQSMSGNTGGSVGYMLRQQPQPEYVPNAYPETMVTLNTAKQFMREKAFQDAELDGFIAEYGVADGESFIAICKMALPLIVYGFDAFEGLDDGGKWKGNIIHQDEFQYGREIPFDVPDNGYIVIGRFNDTVFNFQYAKHINCDKPVAKFLHIDCDNHNPSKEVLDSLLDYIVKGTVIVFDDYFNQYVWHQQSQMSAWVDFCDKHHIKYEYIYCCAPAVTVKVIQGKI